MTLYELSSKELGNKSGVYKLSVAQHVYVGSSKNLYFRLIEHRRDLSKNEHPNQFLQNACNKYGIENISVNILEYCAPEDRIVNEAKWIKQLNSDLNFQDPITNELSDISKQKLSKSVREGRLAGKYKTKFDLHEVECYDYFGDYVCTFIDKADAAEKLNIDTKTVHRLASGYKKGVTINGIRLRYSDSVVPIQSFEVNPQYLGKHYNFYYKDENGNEQVAFTSIKDIYPFLAKQLMQKKESITIYPKLKLRESGKLLTDNAEDNPNPSSIEM